MPVAEFEFPAGNRPPSRSIAEYRLPKFEVPIRHELGSKKDERNPA